MTFQGGRRAEGMSRSEAEGKGAHAPAAATPCYLTSHPVSHRQPSSLSRGYLLPFCNRFDFRNLSSVPGIQNGYLPAGSLTLDVTRPPECHANCAYLDMAPIWSRF